MGEREFFSGMKLDGNAVVSRLKDHFQVSEDSQLAEILGIHKQSVYNWKTRSTVDLKVVLERCADVDLNTLFRGQPFESKEGEKIRALEKRLAALEKKAK